MIGQSAAPRTPLTGRISGVRPRREQVGKADAMQHLAADAVDHREGDVGAILSRINMNAESPLAERRVDNADNGVGDQ